MHHELCLQVEHVNWDHYHINQMKVVECEKIMFDQCDLMMSGLAKIIFI